MSPDCLKQLIWFAEKPDLLVGCENLTKLNIQALIVEKQRE